MDHYNWFYPISGWFPRIDQGPVSDRHRKGNRLCLVKIEERDVSENANRFKVEVDAGP